MSKDLAHYLLRLRLPIHAAILLVALFGLLAAYGAADAIAGTGPDGYRPELLSTGDGARTIFATSLANAFALVASAALVTILARALQARGDATLPWNILAVPAFAAIAVVSGDTSEWLMTPVMQFGEIALLGPALASVLSAYALFRMANIIAQRRSANKAAPSAE